MRGQQEGHVWTKRISTPLLSSEGPRAQMASRSPPGKEGLLAGAPLQETQ